MTHPADDALERGWRLLVVFAGVAQVGVGVALWVNGADGFTLAAFPTWQGIPWWAWSVVAVVGGAAILVPRAETPGLWVAAVWWSMWSGLLIVGIARVGGPFASCSVYVFMAAVHILLAGINHTSRRTR